MWIVLLLSFKFFPYLYCSIARSKISTHHGYMPMFVEAATPDRIIILLTNSTNSTILSDVTSLLHRSIGYIAIMLLFIIPLFSWIFPMFISICRTTIASLYFTSSYNYHNSAINRHFVIHNNLFQQNELENQISFASRRSPER